MASRRGRSDQRVVEEVIRQGAERLDPVCGGVIARLGVCLRCRVKGCHGHGIGGVRLRGRAGLFWRGLNGRRGLLLLLLAAPAAASAV